MRPNDISLTTLDGELASLADHAERAVLIVNVASKCGLTPQYGALEQLARGYDERELTALGVPWNQFMGLEPGTAAEIQTFCSSTIRRDVPLLAESDVNGPDRHLLYAELTKTADVDGQAGDVQWNFREIPRRTGRGGQPVPGARYRWRVSRRAVVCRTLLSSAERVARRGGIVRLSASARQLRKPGPRQAMLDAVDLALMHGCVPAGYRWRTSPAQSGAA